ncbi:MAG: PEP-CTERM sorting domain-containing protein [Verrucomicrobiota bacterium]|nr:PEP-CTERM sorting domain-containing protein [Verrucomicrobiota bacterium]
MNNPVRIPSIILGALLLISTAQAAVLYSGGAFPAGTIDMSNGGTATSGGLANWTTQFVFQQALPAGKTNFSAWAVGDSLSLSFTFTFASNGGPDDNQANYFDFGFGSGSGTTGNSLAYTHLVVLNNGTVAAGNLSRFKTRDNSIYMSGSSGANIGGATDVWNSSYISNNQATVKTYDVGMTITKATTNYDFNISVGSDSHTLSGLAFPAGAGATTDITRVLMRNNQYNIVGFPLQNTLAELSVSNLAVNFTPVPEPASVGLLISLGALGLLIWRRRR